jgi:hypothetical protein
MIEVLFVILARKEVDAMKRLQAETAADVTALLTALLDRAQKGES